MVETILNLQNAFALFFIVSIILYIRKSYVVASILLLLALSLYYMSNQSTANYTSAPSKSKGT